MFRSMLAATLLVLSLCLCAFAEVPRTLDYQGVLTGADGPVVPDGSYTMTFRIYDVPAGGSALWEETSDAAVGKGIFSVTLGMAVPLDLPFDGQYWLGISVEGETELSPRVQLTAVAYSLNAACTRGENLVPATGSVGIGTTAPAEMLDVAGAVKVGGTANLNAGTIRWTGSDFEGYDGGAWHSFTTTGTGTVPPGSSGQTLHHTGSGWAATSSLFNDGANIGIGTTAPTAALDILGGALHIRRNDTQYTEIRNNDADGGYLRVFSPESNKKPLRIGSLYNETGSPSSSGTQIRFYTGNAASPIIPMVLKENGFVGIGTETPARQLEVAGGRAYARLTSSSENGSVFEIKSTDTSDMRVTGKIDFLDAADNRKSTIASRQIAHPSAASGLYLSVDDVHRMVIADNGNVGINSILPTANLEVNGGTIHVRREDEADQYIEVRSNDYGGSRLTAFSPGDNRKALFIGCHHNATGTPNGETWIRFSVGSVGIPVHAMAIRENGNVGIGTVNPSKQLTVRGNILIESESTGDPVAEFGEGLDYAEGFDISEGAGIDAGTVLVIDANNPGKLAVSSRAYDSRVAGIAAGAKGLGSGVRLGVGQFDCDVALAGRVYCNVDATAGAVEPGDLLTTSSTPGHAMKATDRASAQGAILGKAMERLEQGAKRQILVLVTLQ
ncbi:MAG: hypothetical protein JW876_08160 [Candidatus Krumholzibacteriota bacterium]|nr:hypothetical protein [Candidatus Krumholzibacteriota bacterium]